MARDINNIKKVVLNLGCGKTRIPGSIGIDKYKIDNYVDIIHDLDVTPYPFKSSFADEIHMYHVLEHLHNPIGKIEEIFRILKPGGVLYIRVPHFSSVGAFTDITHIRPFGFHTFDIFEINHPQHFYTKAKFKILKKKIKYFGLYPNKIFYTTYIHPNECFFIIKPIVKLINLLINLNPTFFERIWCYWVGGAAEIVINLRKSN